MSAFRGEVLDWFDDGRVPPGRELDVLRAAEIVPAPADWRAFLARLGLWLGTIALASALIFFFAFNWEELPRLAKFGLVEAAIVLGLLACLWTGVDTPTGKAVLLALSLLTGALLALAGQVYQTGADTFELFAWWALLILPWVLIGRFSPLWLFWLALLNLAALLYFQLFREPAALLWTLFGLNLAALIAWEAGHYLGISWLRDNWPPRLIAAAAAFMGTWLMIWAMSDARGAQGALASLAYFAWLAATWAWYRRVRLDLFMLAGGVMSAIVVITFFMAKDLLFASGGSGGLLLIGLVVIGLSGGGAMWLKSVAREPAP
jgi:uncharacterized membrane protein